MEPITTLTCVKIVKGCKARNLNKGTSWQVASVEPLGADYSYAVRVTMRRLNGFGPHVVSLYARHPNRLADASIRLNDGRPEHSIEIVRK